MRLGALVPAAILATLGTSGVAVAQQPDAGAAAPTDQKVYTLPVSLDKIRGALSQPAPAEPLKGLNDPPPTFKVEITEQQRFDDLVSKLKFDKGGPPVPGGIDAYEQYQRAFPRIDNPLAQPYAAFSQGELLQVAITTLIEKYLAGKLVGAVTAAERARAERAAREEVQRALADFWATSPPTTPKH